MRITPDPWKQIGGSSSYNDIYGTAQKYLIACEENPDANVSVSR